MDIDNFEIGDELKAFYKLVNEQDNPVPCTNYPDAFSIDYGEPDYWETIRYAKNLCESCPIRQQCLDYALKNEPLNIWGGMTPNERAHANGFTRIPWWMAS